MFEYHSVSKNIIEVDFEDLPQVLADFRSQLTAKGFSNDQAFQLALELLRKVLISIEEEEDEEVNT